MDPNADTYRMNEERGRGRKGMRIDGREGLYERKRRLGERKRRE